MAADTAEIWRRLLRGQPLVGLGLPMVEGRLDLRNLAAPDPAIVGEHATPIVGMPQQPKLLMARGVDWQAIDFSGSTIDRLLLFDCRIENCLFDGCHCHHWGMWGTTIADSSFRNADLRNSALGGVSSRQTLNSFQRVDFAKANLSGTVWLTASMIDCSFDGSKLSKVDFRATVFKNCRFTGELREVQFARDVHDLMSFPPNEMENVDFGKASLRWVELRRLDMATVKWPESDDHIIVHDYPACLDRVLAFLHSRSDIDAKAVAAVLSNERKRLGANQHIGCVNKKDIIENARNEELAATVIMMFAEAANKN